MYNPFKFLTTKDIFKYDFNLYSIKFNQNIVLNPSEIFYFKNLFFMYIPDFTDFLLNFQNKNKSLNLINYQKVIYCNDINFIYSTAIIDYLYYLNNIISVSYNFNFTNDLNDFFNLFSSKIIFNNNNFYKFLPINILTDQIIGYNS